MEESEDKRDAFRYVFHPARQLPMIFKGRPVRVIDISAGGLAFTNSGFNLYDFDGVTLTLDMPNFTGNPELKARLRILHLTRDNICHCIFENCEIADYELIHKYVLEMQKQDLRNG